MPQITINVPASGNFTTRISAIAQARHAAKFVPPAVPTTINDVAAVKEMIADYLIAVYNQDAVNSAANTAQAEIAAAANQAASDSSGAIT